MSDEAGAIPRVTDVSVDLPYRALTIKSKKPVHAGIGQAGYTLAR
jgi:hypothetical protein